ncbi:SUF system Fe-S cluster assembly regulator [Porticoccus sp.]
MFRISKLTDYGVLLLREMAATPAVKFTPGDLSKQLVIPQPTVSKLLKKMVKGGLLSSSRGKHGGYQLKVDPAELTMASVISVLEGPLAITECNMGPGICNMESRCKVRDHWQHINRAIYQGLEQLSLAAMVQPHVESDTQSGVVVRGETA